MTKHRLLNCPYGCFSNQQLPLLKLTLDCDRPRLVLERFADGSIVRPAEGTPALGLRVVAIDRDFRAQQKLNETHTVSQRRYRIAYRAADAVRAEN